MEFIDRNGGIYYCKSGKAFPLYTDGSGRAYGPKRGTLQRFFWESWRPATFEDLLQIVEVKSMIDFDEAGKNALRIFIKEEEKRRDKLEQRIKQLSGIR